MRLPRQSAAVAMTAFLAGAGVTHFVSPRFYDPMVPTQLPGTARFWVLASGVAEIGVAATVAVPRTRRLGALAAAALFVAVFPANVKMAVDRSTRSPRERAVAYGRLPMQVPLLLWARKVRRDA
ncbi:MauE/DoxX family redox-associated membrane protein [Pseudonocardia sp.]|uniref:DoxX family protein n=1 Tax=Pseudonocardia sp. TaxID=60912 RepID=UPI0026287978|nr:MauE/DoxX family redox-associated membrane protein [Pseudonocardia sp.]MCW2719287.1 hypothetical protein [Pseudonocardia sp.]